ncbi:hypothetical protein XENOCAPTIV_021400, partial [Xenoophorus captivus]
DSDLKQYWMPDSQCKECYDCNEKFTTFRRRHHCRLCGQIFCSRCCNQEIPGKFMGYTGDFSISSISCSHCCNHPRGLSCSKGNVTIHNIVKLVQANISMTNSTAFYRWNDGSTTQ